MNTIKCLVLYTLAIAFGGVYFLMPSYAASDRHAGFYYPVPSAIEEFDSRMRRMPGTTRRMRNEFVTGIMDQIIQRPYSPEVSIFVKGDKTEKLIIIANLDNRLNTIFRVRAYLDTLIFFARTIPIFTRLQVDDTATTLDLLKMLGFAQVTVSDGDTFSHQIIIN